jgi:hypothetical protein
VAGSPHSHRTIWRLDRGASQSVANWRLSWLRSESFAGDGAVSLYEIGQERFWLVDAGRSEVRRFVDYGEALTYFTELCAERRQARHRVAAVARSRTRKHQVSAPACFHHERIVGPLCWERLALTAEQAERYNLPPIIKNDNRFKDKRQAAA